MHISFGPFVVNDLFLSLSHSHSGFCGPGLVSRDSALATEQEALLDMAARPLLPQNNLSAAVLTYNVERVLTDIDADNGNPAVLLRHGVLLVFGAPCQLRSLTGQEHGRTIPLPEVGHLILL